MSITMGRTDGRRSTFAFHFGYQRYDSRCSCCRWVHLGQPKLISIGTIVEVGAVPFGVSFFDKEIPQAIVYMDGELAPLI